MHASLHRRIGPFPTTRGPLNNHAVLRTMGHIGVWAGLYVTAAFVFVAHVAGAAPSGLVRWEALVGVLCIATGAYALDRVKLRNAWIDPADRTGQPDRYEFLVPRASRVRALALVLLAAGGTVGSRVSPWAPVAAAAALLGVTAYAPRPRTGRPRLKDRAWIKNTYIATGIAGFAMLATTAATGAWGSWEGFASHAWGLVAAGALVGLRAGVDAALCDVDDEHADRRFGTSTLATAMGGRWVWRMARPARLLIIGGILGANVCPWRARMVWSAVTACGLAAMRLGAPSSLRDWVDVRFIAESALASAALAAWDAFT